MTQCTCNCCKIWGESEMKNNPIVNELQAKLVKAKKALIDFTYKNYDKTCLIADALAALERIDND